MIWPRGDNGFIMSLLHSCRAIVWFVCIQLGVIYCISNTKNNVQPGRVFWTMLCAGLIWSGRFLRFTDKRIISKSNSIFVCLVVLERTVHMHWMLSCSCYQSLRILVALCRGLLPMRCHADVPYYLCRLCLWCVVPSWLVCWRRAR